MIQKKRFRFVWRFQLHCKEKSKGPKKFMNRFFVEIGPPKNPIIFCISPKFLPLTCKILKKCTKKAKIVVYILQRLKICRTFENMAKNNWIFRRSDLSKESFYELYMTPQDDLSPNLEHLSKWSFCFQKNIIQLGGKYSVTGRTF